MVVCWEVMSLDKLRFPGVTLSLKKVINSGATVNMLKVTIALLSDCLIFAFSFLIRTYNSVLELASKF